MKDTNSYSISFSRQLICAALVFILILLPLVNAQTISDSPFTKENLLSALKYGENNKTKRQSSSWYIQRIEASGVGFQLTPEDENKIRNTGRYLGKKGVDALIAAIRNNYRSPAKTSSGHLSGKILDEQQPVTLNIGGNYLSGSVEALRKGININDILKRIFGTSDPNQNLPVMTVKIYEENNRVLVDAEIYNENSVRVGGIVRNDWGFDPDGKYDRNYNNNAFEIINGNQVPVLQVFLAESNKVYIGGFFRDKGRFYYFTPTGTSSTLEEQNNVLKRIFKYPSSENIGKIETENLPRFKEHDEKAILLKLVANNKLRYNQLANDALKLKAESLIGEITQLYEIFESQIAEGEKREGRSSNAFRKMVDTYHEAKSPEEKQRAEQSIKELDKRWQENRDQIGKGIVDTYKQKMQLDAILIRDEIVRRLAQVPKRLLSPTRIVWRYEEPRNGNDLPDVIKDLQLLVANLQ